MAINKRKVLEAARKHAQKGAQAKALKEFEKLLKLDPRDARLRLEVGDAHRRWGNVDEAIDTYAKVADQYMREGFDARAVAVYKQIHNLKPEAYETYEPLAELYQRMGLVAEAIQALQTAADGYHKQGSKREALELLRKMATLDPTNTTSRIKVADLLRQEQLHEEAIAEYDEASAELVRQGDLEGAAKAYERVLEIEPNRVGTLVKLAENLVQRGLADRAEPMVKRVLQDHPDDPAHYELLASVYRAQKRDDELVDTYRKLSDLYRRRGDDAQARDILQRFVPSEEFESELGIDEATAFGSLGSDVALGDSGTFHLDGEAGGGPLLGASGSAGLGGSSDEAEQTRFDPMALEPESRSKLDDDFLAGDGDSSAALTLGGEGAEEVSLELDTPVGGPLLEVDEVVANTPKPPVGDPEQLLAEASVYLRYGKRDQAIANLEAIVSADAEHRPALEKLGEAYAEGGQGARAVATWLRAAELASAAGDADAVAVLRDRIAAFDEAAAAGLVIEPAGEPDATEDGPAPLDLDVGDDAVDGDPHAHEIDLDDIEIDLDDSEFGDALASASDEAAMAEMSLAEDAAPPGDAGTDESDVLGPGASSSMAEQISEDLEEADFYMKQGLADEAEVIYKRVLSIAPNHPRALVRLGEVAAMRGENPADSGPGAAGAAAANADTAPELLLDDDAGGAGDPEQDSFRSDIAGPDDFDLEVETDDSAGDTPVVGEQTRPDAADSAVEDGLADQFLAEVTGPSETGGGEDDEIEISIDADLGEVRVPSAPAAAEAAPESAPAPVEAAADAVAAAAAPTAVEAEPPAAAPTAVEPEPPAAAAASEPSDDDDADESPASPDDSFGAPAQDLGDPPDLGLADGEPGFDLAAELSDALDPSSSGSSMRGLGDSSDGFAAVFSEFKKGVSKALSESDHEAHFDLGIAYREMGLYEDAKGEFRAAMRNPAREIECRHMLGLCSFEQEQFEEAVAEFEQIAASEEASEGQVLSAQFELGRAWHALGETERARQAFESVLAVDPDFCEVGAHLAALDEPAKQEQTAEPFESFDDLLSEGEDEDEEEEELGGDGPEPATAEYESFDDFLSDDEGPEEAPEAGGGADDARAAGPDLAAEPEPVAEAEPVAEPEVTPEPKPEAEPARPRKRKKISFV